MPISVNVSGTWRALNTPKVNVSGTWRTVSKVWIRVGGIWKEVWASTPLSAYPSTGFLSASTSGSGSQTTSSVSCIASGGTPGYSYLWEWVSGTTFSINSSTSSATTFTYGGSAGQTFSGTYRCRVTDAASTVVYTSTFTVQFSWY